MGLSGGGSMPPTNDLLGYPVGRGGGGAGGMDAGYDMRFSGGGGMPYPPGGGDILPPGSNPSLQNPSRGTGLNPALVQQMSMVGGGGGSGGGPLHPGAGPAPPRPGQSAGGGGGAGGPPSTSQLRLLVQQIQMAVQAGHLNAQILNQPLAPQTLLLLNQLLQQIKALAQCTQQHAMAVQASAGGRGPSSQALLHFNVQITKHKQQITNLQNQITAQQAQYLKNQQPQPPMVPGGGMGVPDSADLSLSLGNLSMSGVDHHQQQQQQGGVGGSKLTKWIKSDAASSGGDQPDFSRAPGTTAKGSSSSNSQQPSPNILLDPAGPWSNGNNGAGGGWPDSSGDKNGGSNAADTEPDFGIPEFVPGKAWKGATIKDPSEDPTLTPGSVATTPILLQQQQQPGDKVSAVSSSSSIATTMMENSLGLASSTWSFGTTVKESSMQVPNTLKHIRYRWRLTIILGLVYILL
jgi:trinucleotide repeat-containing gene 6 protein